MRKHLVIGVLALAVLMLGAVTLNAGDGTVYMGADGECCTLVNGACVPCECRDGVSTSASITPATLAVATFATATTQLASAGCDPSQCEPMTAEQCAALGFDVSKCSTTGAKLISTKSVKASGCGGAPCAPSPGCGTGSGCAAGTDTSI